MLIVLLVVVCGAVLAVHWPALSAKALSFDDEQYFVSNRLVRSPSWSSAKQFLTEVFQPSTVQGYYQPLSMISLMVDYALGGRPENLFAFHRTSLALHMANTALIIVFLYMLFGKVWPAAIVGLLFGLHPMTIEPIPWVGERKTLLAVFFALWCFVLYIRYSRKSGWLALTICVLMYALSLMSKPTVTLLPLLLLLLDYWPLRRLSKKVLIEKVPFFVVGGISVIVTYISQSRSMAGVISPVEHGLKRIVLILCHNVIFYPYKVFWPANVSSHYPFPEPLSISEPMVLAGVIGTCVLLLVLLISLRWTRALLTPWLFFFLAILPAMQVIGFSNVIASDKFAYFPSLGFLMVLAWVLCRLFKADGSKLRYAAIAAAVLVIAGSEAISTRRHLAHWRDTESLYEYMLTTEPNIPSLHGNLGFALKTQGRLDEALSHYRQALKISPGQFDIRNNMADVLIAQGKLDEAIGQLRQILRIRPDFARAHTNMGNAMAAQGKLDEAINSYNQSLKFKPDYAEAYSNIGNVLAMQGKLDEALANFHKALEIAPYHTEVYFNLANVLLSQGKVDEAISNYRLALRERPDFADAHDNLGNAFLSQGKLEEAISHYRKAIEIEPNHAQTHYNLALALKMTGQNDASIKHFKEALRLKPELAK